ncbi:DUF4915 domain-containing protein [Micromonospora tulbaghiae]|uniref:Acetolactate synthase-1/2/3 large subunit n=1 Tax=Micromonospora tulbaghiae TaxID=479978 RepID=A0AAW4JLP3_9ACTN|nr:DUF4915 domain-containing protein [Micromonospora tulbaghiae]MBO4139754.1 DUF4915 domain-containing protein [Micromonospora tulbaghiae]SCF01728.1 acetolactate synthase-1/2/3 large subunit [Micromonospora tulbaghiae]
MTEKTYDTWSGTRDLLPPGHVLLSSCFDAHHTIGGGLFSIGKTVEVIDRVSSTGMCADDSLLYRCLWSAEGSPAELVAYDSAGVRRYQRLDDVSTPHDILCVNDQVLVVATTQNEVQSIGRDGEVLWRWRAPGEPDSWHLNSLARYGDRIVVSGFGPFLRRRGWDENGKPSTGRVVALDTGEPLLSGFRAPHHPHYSDGMWLVCDSAAGELVELPDSIRRPTRRLPLPGWPRGLAVTPDHLYVGISPHRYLDSSVDTAAVAVVDRAQWRVLGVIKLPAREIYSLAVVPEALAEGARHGFNANNTRTHEQGQRQLFDQLGKQPRQLWAVGDHLREEECRITVTPEEPIYEEIEAGSLLSVACLIQNTGAGMLTPAPPKPVRVVSRWYDADGEPVPGAVAKSALPRSLPPESATRVLVRARVPEEAGRYRLRITLAQDDGLVFDELHADNLTEIEFDVVPDGVRDDALAEFGLYPSEVRAARMANTVEEFLHSLLHHPDGAPRALSRALIADRGAAAFGDAVAAVLGCSPDSIRYVVNQALDGTSDLTLTGAEAIALMMHRLGVTVAFTYAGTSELALCDATARLGILRNGRGDRESVFQAAGASMLRPGHGAAIVHAARGLTNALGAVGAARRNEVGTLVVVGMPSTASAPFLPPHGEPRLIEASGEFAKAAFELGPVPPADAPDERAAAAAHLVDVLHQADLAIRQAPCGPVLLGVPQDVAESSWVPLERVLQFRPADPHRPVDRDTLREAAARLTGAGRPVVLIDDYALRHEGMRPALAAFSRATGSAVLQVKYRRGPMLFERVDETEVPGFVGWYDPNDQAHRRIMEATDMIVTVEDRNMYPRVIGELPPGPKIALTSKPAGVRKNGYLTGDDLLVDGDVVGSLHELAAVLGDRNGAPRWYAESVREPSPPRHVVPTAALTVREGLARAVTAVAGEQDRPVTLVDDSQMFGGLLAEVYDLLPAGVRVFGDHGGFVGGGTATATGLAVGEAGVSVICTVGDQGLTNGIQGLVSAVQENAPITFVVCNNGGSVSLRKQSRGQTLLNSGFHQYLDNAAGMRYAEIAEVLGMQARRVDLTNWLDGEHAATRLTDFRQALSSAVNHAGPSLIELVLPSDPEFWTGVWITEGFEPLAKPAVKVEDGAHA